MVLHDYILATTAKVQQQKQKFKKVGLYQTKKDYLKQKKIIDKIKRKSTNRGHVQTNSLLRS